jgi:dephospho-CoA kinase
MLKTKKIAVTGGLAAGKTTVCQIFKELGAYVVSADEIVHQLLSPGTTVGQQVIKLLGSDIISGQELDRKKIAAKVFFQRDLLHLLEEIIHPAVFDEIEREYQKINQKKTHVLFFAEVPLLYESRREDCFDAIIAVFADSELCRKRIFQHNPLQEFERRMTRQMDPLIKADKAHYSIENNGDMQELKAQVQSIYSQLTKE